MGKYRHLYRALTKRYCPTKKKVAIKLQGGLTVDKPLSYEEVQSVIATPNTCAIHPLPHLPSGELPNAKGAQRSLDDLLLMIAKRALTVPHPREELSWLNSEEGHFQYALGGDSAPVNKAKDLTMVMVSVLNCGSCVGSPSENFVLAAADTSELDPVWEEVVRQAEVQGQEIAGESYNLCGTRCRFTPRLVSADQKWLAHLAGELTNSATFFTTFADVSNNKMQERGLTFRVDQSAPADFYPWAWERRMSDAAAVAAFQAGCDPSWSEAHVHKEVLGHLAKTLKSRREK